MLFCIEWFEKCGVSNAVDLKEGNLLCISNNKRLSEIDKINKFLFCEDKLLIFFLIARIGSMLQILC